MGLVLFIVALVLVTILTSVSWVVTPLYYVVKFKIKEGLSELNKWFLNLAKSLDQFGNTSCSKILELTLTKSGGFPFGNIDETVSYVLGRNMYRGTLTRLGKWVVYLLNLIERNHVEKAVENQKEQDKKIVENYNPDDYYL